MRLTPIGDGRGRRILRGDDEVAYGNRPSALQDDAVGQALERLEDKYDAVALVR